MNNADTPDNDKIRRDLVRPDIKEPLYYEIAKAENQARGLAIIIELNDEYYEGFPMAADCLTQQVNEAVTMVGRATAEPVVVASIGGMHNPYFKARLPPDAILALVELD